MHQIHKQLLNDIGIFSSFPISSENVRSMLDQNTQGSNIIPEYTDTRFNCHEYKQRPIHRYCRISRFIFVLNQLLGISGTVPIIVKHVVRLKFDMEKRQVPQSKIWNFVRARLKEYGWRLYYNRIPEILAHPPIREKLGFNPALAHDDFNHKHRLIIRDFIAMHHSFNRTADPNNRRYFPNLRFVALHLMERHDLLPPYAIPHARTFRKRRSIGEVFDRIAMDVHHHDLDNDGVRDWESDVFNYFCDVNKI